MHIHRSVLNFRHLVPLGASNMVFMCLQKNNNHLQKCAAVINPNIIPIISKTSLSIGNFKTITLT